MEEGGLVVSPKALAQVWGLVREKIRTEDLEHFARTEKGIYAMWAQKELDCRKEGRQA